MQSQLKVGTFAKNLILKKLGELFFLFVILQTFSYKRQFLQIGITKVIYVFVKSHFVQTYKVRNHYLLLFKV